MGNVFFSFSRLRGQNRKAVFIVVLSVPLSLHDFAILFFFNL